MTKKNKSNSRFLKNKGEFIFTNEKFCDGQERPHSRFVFIPLNYENKDKAHVGELLVGLNDDNLGIYVMNEDKEPTSLISHLEDRMKELEENFTGDILGEDSLELIANLVKDQLDGDIKEIQKDVTTIECNIDNIKSTIRDEVKVDLSQLTGKVAVIEDKLNNNDELKDELKEYINKEISDLDLNVEVDIDEIEDLVKSSIIDEFNKKVVPILDGLDSDIGKINGSLNTLDVMIDDLKDEIKNLNPDVVNDLVKDIQDKVDAVEEGFEEVKESVTRMEISDEEPDESVNIWFQPIN